MTNLAAIAVLLALNGFFVAAEFALVKARGFRLENMAAAGSAPARLTVLIQANLEAYLAACQLGITMASLGLGWVGEPAVAALLEPLFIKFGVPEPMLHTSAFLLGFLLFSSLHIVIGEQVPKTFAIRKAEQVSLWVAYPLHWAYLLVWPLNWLLNNTSRAVLSFFNVAEATHGEVFTDEELKDLVSSSRDHGSIEHDKADMLRNLFEFDQRNIGRVMIPRKFVHVLDLAKTPEENKRVVIQSGHSRFPLINSQKNDEFLGVVLAKVIYRAMVEQEQAPWRRLQDYCQTPLIVLENQKIAKLFELMRARRQHFAFVVDEYGSLSGIVTLEDLLEEIVGDIEDETDATQPAVWIRQIGEFRWQVDGLVSLADLQRAIALEVEDQLHANTVSGLLMERLNRMPQAGDSIAEGAYTISVLDIIDRRVGTVDIQYTGAKEHPNDNNLSGAT